MMFQFVARSFRRRIGWFCALYAGSAVLAWTAPNEGALDTLPGRLAIAQNADGRLELFKIDSEGEARHRWQKENGGDWSVWASLGGAFLPGVAANLDKEGRMVVFAADRAGALHYSVQQTRNGHEWSNWVNLGGTIRAPVVVGQQADGRLEIFCIDRSSGAVKQLGQTGQPGEWTSWADLGIGPAAGLTLAHNSDGRLELFGVDAGQRLVHCWQRQANTATHWSEWGNLGGAIVPGLGVEQNSEGQLEVFAVSATNHSVYRLRQAVAGDSSKWLPWVNFRGEVMPGITVARNADGRLEIFGVKNPGSDVMHRWQLKAREPEWSQWYSLAGSVQPPVVVGHNMDGNLEIFAINAKNRAVVDHRRQISANSDWLDWFSMDRLPFAYASRLWQTDDGLPLNKVQAITQTRDGYLWVGTAGGLVRFDGIAFTRFDSRLVPQIKDASISALLVDASGTLWIGAEGEGLMRVEQGKISRFTKTNGLAGNNPRVIYQSRDQSIWIGTSHGLSRFKNGEWVNYTKKQGLLSDVIRALYEDRTGYLWIGTGNGLNRWKDGVMESFAETNGLPNNSIRAIFQDKGGRLWIGSDKGMIWYNTGNFYDYSTEHGLSDTFVSAILEDSASNLWVGTYSGLNRFIEGRFRAELTTDGLPYDQVNALFEDKQGNLWAGSREGLIRLTAKPFVSYTTRQGLSHNNVTSVLEDRSGNLWAGTWGGGLDKLAEDKVKVYATTNRFPHDLILSLCQSRDGSLWVGADYDGGLVRLKGRAMTHYTWKDGLINAGLRVIQEGHAGELWIGTSRGLTCFKDGKFVNDPALASLSNNIIRALCEDHQHALWIGTDRGLCCWKNGALTNLTEKGFFPAATVGALYEDPQNSLWIGSIGCGLVRCRHGQFTIYTTQQGLFSDEILEILEDSDGWLWIASAKGIFRVRKSSLDLLDRDKETTIVSIAYGKADGLESTLCSAVGKPGGWKTRDGKLCFATTKGLAVIEPRQLQLKLSPPAVFIEDLRVNGRQWRPLPGLEGGRTSGALWAAASGAPLQIPPGHGDLEFSYTALDFRAPEKCRFKYKLEGVNSDWIEAGSRRTAFYNNIYPGQYRFRVIACDKDGVWNEAGASLALFLQPHFWQTWWCRMMALAGVVGVAGGSARYATQRRMQRKLEVLERTHAAERARGRIAKDIQDDLGASLTRIMMLGMRTEGELSERRDVGVHLRKIVNFSRATIQSMDEIVWAVNPKNDTLDGLVGYLNEYVVQLFQDSGIRCRLELPVASHIMLPSDVRHDLFLVVKEALNNVLKHAKASEIQVQILSEDSAIRLIIEDNGCGFDAAQKQEGRRGNGLRNMRKRMDSLGGRMEISTTPGHGAKLQFVLPVQGKPPLR